MEYGGISVKSARQAIVVFLMKLGWRLLIKPNASGLRVVRAKYCKRRCDVDMFIQKAGTSNV